MRFSALVVALSLALLATACGSRASTAPEKRRLLTVAAAADLKFALDDIITKFAAAHPDVDVRVSYGSSGNFHAQLTQQAPFDLYFSADIGYPQQLIDAGVADKDTLFEYAVGRIVIWVPGGSPIDVEKLKHEALLHESAHNVAIANPAHAPYGRAAEAAMRDMGVYDAVKERLVLGENIAQTAQFIDTGAADIGIIALSLAIAPKMKAKGSYWEIPLKHFPRMLQGAVVLRHAKNRGDAMTLRDYVTSKPGREILREYGFYMPDE